MGKSSAASATSILRRSVSPPMTTRTTGLSSWRILSASSCATILNTDWPVVRNQVKAAPKYCGCNVLTCSVTRSSGRPAASMRQANSSRARTPDSIRRAGPTNQSAIASRLSWAGRSPGGRSNISTVGTRRGSMPKNEGWGSVMEPPQSDRSKTIGRTCPRQAWSAGRQPRRCRETTSSQRTSHRVAASQRPSPILESRLGASPADPRKGPIGRTLGAIGDVPAPRVRPDWMYRLPNDIKGPGIIELAYHDRLGKMMIGVHHNLEAARRLDSLTVHRLPDRIYVGSACLDNGLRPHPEANEGGLHRVIRRFVTLLGEVRPHLHERFIFWRLD